MILDRLSERISIDWSGFAVTHGGFFGWFGPAEYEPWPGGRPPEPEPAIVAAGGYCAPLYDFGQTRSADGWDSWRRWYCVHRIRLADLIPPFTAQRGGIRFLQPPPIGHPSREWDVIADDPYRQTAERQTSELLGSDLCLARLDSEGAARCNETLWPDGDGLLWRCPAGHVWNSAGQQQHTPAEPLRAMPPPVLPPQPGQRTWNMLQPAQRSISDLIRLRLRRRR